MISVSVTALGVFQLVLPQLEQYTLTGALISVILLDCRFLLVQKPTVEAPEC